MAADKLGYITAGRAVCQALASGLGGYLGHQFDRRLVIAAGCFIWGVMTMLFSFSSSWQMGALLWAWNGVGLAFVIPNSQSLIADFFDDEHRGKAFGTLYTTGALSSAAAQTGSRVRVVACAGHYARWTTEER